MHLWADIVVLVRILRGAGFLDKFLKQAERIKRIYPRLKRLPKAVKPDTLAEVAGKLASMNKPNRIDYLRLFCSDDVEGTPNMPSPARDAAIYCDYVF